MRSWGWGPTRGLVSSEEKETRTLSFHPVTTQRGGEKAVLCEPGRGPSLTNRPAGNLTLDFPASRTVRNKYLTQNHLGERSEKERNVLV